MARVLPTPDEYVKMPWHARRRLRERLAHEPPEAVPLTAQMTADLNETIRLLNDLLNEHWTATHRRHP